jgi:hypothetical protein
MKTQITQVSERRLIKGIRRALNAPIYTLPAFMLATSLVCAPAYAQQQTGGIKGQVRAPESQVSVAGVEVTATSSVMPRARSTTTKTDGSFSLPLLIPGDYSVSFAFADGTTRTISTRVLLDQNSVLTLDYADEQPEVITVSGSVFVLEGNSSLTNSFSADVLEALPTGQNYRDMLKILPGVAYSENSTLGPSAGGSGSDNSYGFDGVDLSLPLFGNLSSEPSTHDIASVSVDRGAAKAIGFNRSGGFSVNTVSKSGTNEFHGSLEYRLQNADFSATPESGVIQDTDSSWIIGSVSGPIIADQLFFYASYYRPEVKGDNKVTAYGPAKSYNSVRDEFFGKLTWAPIEDLLINVSQRSSNREVDGSSIGEFETDSVSVGSESDLSIFSLDGSYLFGDSSTFTFKYGKYEEDTSSQPDVILDFVPRLGDALNIAALDQQGYFSVPSLDDDDAVFNAGALPLIQQFGYDEGGQRLGGGGVGVYSTFNNQDFARESVEFTYTTEFEFADMYHNLHVGFKWSELEEDLSRLSNGWGAINYLGGQSTEDDLAGVYFQARVEQMSLLDETGDSVSTIQSFAESYNFEVNDTIEHGDFTYNVGVLISKDILYGQGLRENGANVSGFEVAAGNKYEMYSVDWKDMIQPRLGITYTYEDQGTVFANYASYNPQASSLARAASWDRNSRRSIIVNFDDAGEFMSAGGAAGSSGKFFQENMKPRRIDELTIGATNAVNDNLLVRSHLRYRYGSHFWEDMPNAARLYGDYTGGSVPADIAAKGEYIPELADYRDEVGGSSYVIAEVDGGQTKYWEWSVEAEWHGDRTYLSASYVWSHYYGNFDQDNTTAGNDANNFIGSSFYGDGKGRMVWDQRYGTLIGDKPHKFKAQGYYELDWDATVGAYFVFQSGEAWTAWDGSLYGYSSSTSRYAEPAGSRRGASHWQLDLNYTQDYVVNEDITLKFRADLYNVFNKQTGYNYNPYTSDDTFGKARSYYNPRRIQLSVGLTF